MRTKPIQIYLTDEQYSALHEAAVRYGKPMTALVRDLIQAELVEGTPPPTDISDLVGSVHVGYPIDFAKNRDQMLEDAVFDLHRH